MRYKLLTTLAIAFCSAAFAQTPNTRLDSSFVYDPTEAGNFYFEFQEYGLNRVHALSDGKVMIVGSFREIFNSVAGIMRLNADGSIDMDFQAPNVANDQLFIKGRSFLELANGKYLVGGIIQPSQFSGFVTGLLRLNADGSRDTSFGQGLTYPSVQALARQPDGKILIGGAFASVEFGASIARLNEDGSIDKSFYSEPLMSRDVREITVLPDGRLLVAGNFTDWPTSGASHSTVGLALLNADGTLDVSFSHDATTSFSTVVNAYPRVAVQPDGKIVVAGLSPSSRSVVQVIRYNTDFTVDETFYEANNPEIGGSNFTGVSILSDGKILLSGAVTKYDGDESISGVFRLNSDGTIDETFNTNYGFGNSAQVYDCSIQADGKILLFTTATDYQENDLTSNDYPVRQLVVRLNGDVGTGPNLAAQSGDNPEIQLFPNPVHDVLFLSGIPQGAEVQLFDIQGKEVFKKRASADLEKIQLGHIPSGIYVVRMTNDSHQFSKKVLIER